MSRRTRARGRVSLCLCVAAAALFALPPIASAGVDSRGNCLGLDCSVLPGGGSVPEARSGAPAVDGVDQLRVGRESGFYTVPAPIYQGDIAPQAVVYLSKPGQLERMPASVRQLPVVRNLDLNRAPELKTSTIVIIGPGALRVYGDDVAAARQGKKQARAAHGASWAGCQDQNFCVYTSEGMGGVRDDIYGPTYYGTGWWNWGSGTLNNNGESMVNHRDNGDSLMADLTWGDGARYCAHEHTDDTTFSNNFGNNVNSSFALLGSDVNRC